MDAGELLDFGVILSPRIRVLVPRRTKFYGPDLLTDRTVRYVQLRNYARRRGLLTGCSSCDASQANTDDFL